jgi:hypothetical protein
MAHRKNYIDIDIELLKKLHIEEGKNLTFLADNVFFVARQTLMNRLKENDIKKDVPKGKRSNYMNIDIEILKDLYYNKKKSMHEIARHFKVSYYIIEQRMKEHHLDRRHKSAHMKKGE